MTSRRFRRTLARAAALALVPACLAFAPGVDTKKMAPLWQIGWSDNKATEFALAPGGYEAYGRDGDFVVARSDPARDWPYCHPGPADLWAGSRPHTFRIRFAMAERPSAACRLVVDLVDTHSQRPPTLTVIVNGRALKHACGRGGGDGSIQGEPGAGREHRFAIRIAPEVLKAGINEICIINGAGSWIVYDCLAFDAPPGTRLSPVPEPPAEAKQR